MLLLPAILAVAFVAGMALGGKPRNLAARRIRLWWLAPLGLALQLLPVPDVDPDSRRLLATLMLGGSYAAIMAVAAANWREPGFLMIVIGFAMNLAVIAANQGMPVSESALRASGGAEDVEVLRGAEGKHHLAGEDDVLLPLADVIGLPSPFNAVVSVGDVVAYLGAGVFLAVGMLRGPRPEEWSGPQARRARPSGTRRSRGRHRPVRSR